MEENFSISELICTRISHDLISNIGAFANAMELLEDEDDEFAGEIKSTLKICSKVLTARMKFFRLAFGLSNSNLENFAFVQSVTTDYLQTLNMNHPITLECKISDAGNFNRIVMLAAMAAADTIVRGGKVEIGSDSKYLKISAVSSANLATNKINAMREVLQGGLPDNLSALAPFLYMQKLLLTMGRQLELSDTGNEFTLLIS